MTLTLERPEVDVRSGDGGIAARRAMVRWAWRLFRREWRQQLLVLSLVIVAVAITVAGAGVAVNTPIPSQAGFGTADAMIQVQNPGSGLPGRLSSLQHLVGTVDIISNQTITVPGSIDTFALRAQSTSGRYGAATLAVVSGRFPHAAHEVAVTATVASDFNLHVGSTWSVGGADRQVVGIVQDPLNTLDEFALVPPGQLSSPTSVTMLFDATPAQLAVLGSQVQIPPSTFSGGFNPEIFTILIATVGMLLIGLVSVGGFTVLAQRRMRSIGMVGALGATDRNIRRVVRSNGLVVGLVGTAVGAGLGLLAWVAYRPHVEAASHHVFGTWALPWVVILPSMGLAVLATWLAAARPARAAARVPIVTALSGRPAPPRQLHRSALPGVIFVVGAYVLLLYAGLSKGNGGGAPELVFGFVALTVGLILLAPFAITMVALLARRAPLAPRMALRDLSRYRARSGSALGAVSLAVLIAATICVAAAARYGNPLDYAGANLANNQLNVYTNQGPPAGGESIKPGPNGTEIITPNPPVGSIPSTAIPTMASQQATADAIAAALGSHEVVELDTPDANLVHRGLGRNFNGQVFVATPQLLRAFGISASQIDPRADILTMRPGLAGVSNLDLEYGNAANGPGPGPGPGNNAVSGSSPCPPGQCVASPDIQTLNALPAGTSGPNTVITEHAMKSLALQSSPYGWLVIAQHPLTTAQINGARQTASSLGMTVESKSDAPSSAQVINWATFAGIALALAILAMTVGLIRSETASDLRTLAATGAASTTRRTLTAATAATLALIGAVMGTAAAYLACIAFFSGSPNGDGIGELANIPLTNLALIIVGLPAVAALVAWLVGGRQPEAISHQPME